MNPIEVRGLGMTLGGKTILRGLDLTVRQQAVYGLLGRNGAGKTTLLKVLMGLYRADAGEARVLGQDLSRGCPPEKKRVGYVAEGDFLPGYASVAEIIQLECGLREEPDPGYLHAWLKKEGIPTKSKIGGLSKGLKKRLELELLMLGRPLVMILDEPFDGLDPLSRREFMGRLTGYLAETKSTVLISSHILGDLERLCDRIGVLAGGKIALEEKMDRLKEKRKASLEELGAALISRFEAKEGSHV